MWWAGLGYGYVADDSVEVGGVGCGKERMGFSLDCRDRLHGCVMFLI